MKRCSKCGVEKGVTEFSRKAKSKDGLHSYCKACKVEYDKRYYAENRDKVREYQKRYYAENSDKARERQKRYYAENPDKAREYQKRYYAENRDKAREYQKRYYAENSDKARERQKRYYAENPDKARERQKRYYAENRDKAREYQKRYYAENRDKAREYQKRYYAENPDKVRAIRHRRRARIVSAGGSFTAADIAAIRVAQADRCWYCGKRLHGKGHIDHFIPLVRGGTNDPGNLRLACASCNLRKGAALPTELGLLL